jgi:universal stress protein A
MNTFPPKQILVPTDFSDSAKAATQQAFALASAIGAKVHLLTVYQLYSHGMSAVMADRVLEELYASHQRQLAAEAEPYRSSNALGELIVKLGDPREVILEIAKDLKVDLIMMGTVGRRGLRHVMAGSVAESVVRTAGCPVMVIRA